MLLLATCTVDPQANSSYGCDGCPSGKCYKGAYCLLGLTTDSLPDPITGANAVRGEPCAEEGQMSDCYTGPEGTRDRGLCAAGRALCSGAVWGPCDGEVVPSKRELCDGQDDDCDGDVDEEPMLGACTPTDPGACAGRQVCDSGQTQCLAILEAGEEICNGADDDCDGSIDEAAKPESCDGVDEDCDGVIDEGADQPCYSDALGCTQTESGDFACVGLCKAGTQRCTDGTLSRVCQGQVTPVSERCDSGGVAADEDCDSTVNEDCACVEGQSRDCYDGPQGTQGVGICRGGRQMCAVGVFGDCGGETLPQDETCLNMGTDDDCNNQMDDVRLPGTIGSECMAANAKGDCRRGTYQCTNGDRLPTCVAPPDGVERCGGMDEDCDGKVDEGFNLATSPTDCGECGRVCRSGECVAGVCTPEGGGGGTGGGAGAEAGAGGAGGVPAP